MKIFFYIGPNKELKSGFSIKFWKIERQGRKVTVHFGPAKLDHIARKVITASWTRSRSWILPSERLAPGQRAARSGLPSSSASPQLRCGVRTREINNSSLRNARKRALRVRKRNDLESGGE